MVHLCIETGLFTGGRLVAALKRMDGAAEPLSAWNTSACVHYFGAWIDHAFDHSCHNILKDAPVNNSLTGLSNTVNRFFISLSKRHYRLGSPPGSLSRLLHAVFRLL
eukprot:COSAG02_NODE_4210_length_5625_cov_16.612921_4_plen_107_part_00